MSKLNATDIQGFVLRGYNLPVARYLFLRLEDVRSAAKPRSASCSARSPPASAGMGASRRVPSILALRSVVSSVLNSRWLR